MYLKTLRWILALLCGMALTALGGQPVTLENKAFRLEFDISGRPKSLFRKTDGKELLDPAKPGLGFYLSGIAFGKGFLEHGAVDRYLAKTHLDNLSFDGKTLVARNGYKKLTFEVKLADQYMAMSLKRIEGLAPENLETLRFELGVVEDIALHPLDHMTHQTRGFGVTDGFGYTGPENKSPQPARVYWQWLWDRDPSNPLGAFAMQCPRSFEEHDENLLHIWAGEESLPHPMVDGSWTVERAREWVAGWSEWESDIRSITIEGSNSEELQELVDFAEVAGMNQIKLFTHIWRGGFWPIGPHLECNPEIFPGGMEEFQAFSDYVHDKGMKYELHTLSMSIWPDDPKYVAGPDGIDPRLAHWVEGQLEQPFNDGDSFMYFRPDPGQTFPSIGYHSGPNSFPSFFKIPTFAVGRELMNVEEFIDTDKPVWKLRIGGARGMHGTEKKDHEAGTRVMGMTKSYGQSFTADSNSSLINELARDYGEFCNQYHVTALSLDGLEIRADKGYGPAKFCRELYRHIDHYTTSGTSSGGAMPFHMEYWFSTNPWSNGGTWTMPLALERSGRRATNPYEVHTRVAFGAAKGYSIGGLMKPEPMFGLSTEMLDTYGLSDHFVEKIKLWHKVVPLLNDEQRKVILDGYRSMAKPGIGGNGQHSQTDVLFEPRIIDGELALQPLSLLTRPDIDDGWGTGQEFGPIAVWQFVSVDEPVQVQNRFGPGEPEFVIHVMPALADRGEADKAIKSEAVDKDVEGYDIGAGLATALQVEGVAKDHWLQPEVKDILAQGEHQFTAVEGGIQMSFNNLRNQPVTQTERLPWWEVKTNSDQARALAMTVEGDGSGAVLLIRLSGRGSAEYIVPLDFTGPRDIVIPNGTASWTDKRWFWRMGLKNMYHEQPIGRVSMGMGWVPARTEATVKVSNLRLLAEVPGMLVNPTLTLNGGSLQIQGDVESDHYIWFAGGDDVGVYDINWNEVKRLPVKKTNFTAPGQHTHITYTVLSEGKAPHPQLGVQIFTKDAPIMLSETGPVK